MSARDRVPLRARLRTATAGAVGAGYAAGWATVRTVPEPVAGAVFRLGADVGWWRAGKGVARLEANLARVLGPGAGRLDRAALTREATRSYARYWREVFRLQHMPAELVLARTEVHGREHLDAALAGGRGVVFALPHLGNWDAAAVWLIGQGVPFTTVAERLEPASLFDRFVAFRESLGMEVLALSGGERPPLDVLAERLAGGRAVCLLADRDLTAGGVQVQLFGATTRMPAGPAVLATRTGAPLVPTGLWFTPRGWGIRFYPPVPEGDVATRTQALADTFADAIAAHPADWHMLQRLWLDDLEADDPRRASRPAAP